MATSNNQLEMANQNFQRAYGSSAGNTASNPAVGSSQPKTKNLLGKESADSGISRGLNASNLQAMSGSRSSIKEAFKIAI